MNLKQLVSATLPPVAREIHRRLDGTKKTRRTGPLDYVL